MLQTFSVLIHHHHHHCCARWKILFCQYTTWLGESAECMRGKQKNQWKILLRTKFHQNIFNCAINHRRGKLQSEKRELKYFSIHFVMVEAAEEA